ncbi:MAG TPA: hypothetical protein VMF50_02310 [Candidatus Binataceae bacterium]|nr:hypothetical protein [Candidatus Binataceae bacterium]
MAGEVLHVFERHVLLEQIVDDGDAEAVGEESSGRPPSWRRRLNIWRMECAE